MEGARMHLRAGWPYGSGCRSQHSAPFFQTHLEEGQVLAGSQMQIRYGKGTEEKTRRITNMNNEERREIEASEVI